MSVAISRRHHFLPQFYLKAWYESETKGFWLYRRNPAGDLIFDKKNAKQVGFEVDLNTMNLDGIMQTQFDKPDWLEIEFFQRLDNDAAKVHKKLINSGVGALDADDKKAWALFTRSLMERHPDAITSMVESLDDSTAYKNLLLKLNTSPDQFRATVDFESLRRNLVLRGLPNKIRNDQFVDALVEMNWAICTCREDDFHILLSDCPVLINGGAGGYPLLWVTIPISSNKLLLIYADADIFDEQLIGIAMQTYSAVAALQSKRYLIAAREVKPTKYVNFERIATMAFLNAEHANLLKRALNLNNY